MGESIAGVGDLAGLCGHDGTDWLKVKVDANGYLRVIGAGVAGALEVTQDTPGDLLMGQHQYTGSAWKKSNMLWGYNDVVSQYISDLNLGAGTDSIVGATVGPGEVWVVSAITAYVASASCTGLYLRVTVDGVTVDVRAVVPPVSGRRYVQTGQFILKEGDYVDSTFTDLTAGDDGDLNYTGYKMMINM